MENTIPPVRTKRNIYFASIDIELTEEHKMSAISNSDVKELFEKFAILISDKSEARYLPYSQNRTIFMTGLNFDRDNNYITGKLYSIRKDIFPEIINMEDDTVTPLIGSAKEGVAEATHFVIDYSP